ncbi:hypothetical protein SKAU_G00180870 [Synaphobranchus kaupii]|uniref:Uncharacterized protein n=1 Tax=Synaphobranchus kaupii TaxID=118154 RepID=A0A9Q1J1S1_SYNKA|nr:hypothetical protein SKAU_G00180870 [Synaphobranchus kaupii]
MRHRAQREASIAGNDPRAGSHRVFTARRGQATEASVSRSQTETRMGRPRSFPAMGAPDWTSRVMKSLLTKCAG